jgi:hypothetical protein
MNVNAVLKCVLIVNSLALPPAHAQSLQKPPNKPASQEKPTVETQPNGSVDAVLSPKQMRDDLAFLREKMIVQHPHPWLYCKQSDFDALYHRINSGLNQPLTKMEFYRRVAVLASSLKDGHTLVEPLISDFSTFAKTGGVLPIEVAFVGSRLYVTQNGSGDPHLVKGVEIISINGECIPAVVDRFRGLINDVHPIYDVYARLFREMYWLEYGAPTTFKIAYRNPNGTTGTVRVGAHVYADEEFHSYQSGGEAYSFRLLPNQAGLLTINSFSPSPGFDAFLDQTFATLEDRHTPALIIDVRRNGGGSGRLAQQTISYLTDKPFETIGAFYVKVTPDLKKLYTRGDTHTDEDTKNIVMNNPNNSLVDGLKDSGPIVITPPHRDHLYRGRTYLLTANNTFSAAAMFAAYFKCNHLGSVIGEEPGQTTDFVADAVPFTMPNSGLEFGVSFSEIHMPCEQSYYHGIQPDFPVSRSPHAVAAGEDQVLDEAVKLISSSLR